VLDIGMTIGIIAMPNAASSSKQDITFLPILETGETQRQKEIARSIARSHASRVSHARRYPNKRKDQCKHHQHQAACRICSPSTSTTKILPQQQYQSTAFRVKWKGNSDPFDSQAIVVTPRVNEAIYFQDKHIIAALCAEHSESLLSILTNYTKTKPATTRLEILTSSCFATTFIFSTMVLMDQFREGPDIETLVFQRESVKLLRLSIALNNLDFSLLIASIFHMLTAAVYLRDEIAVNVHGGAFCEMVHKNSDKGYLATSFLIHMRWTSQKDVARSLTKQPFGIASPPPPMISGKRLPVWNDFDESLARSPFKGHFTAMRQAWSVRKTGSKCFPFDSESGAGFRFSTGSPGVDTARPSDADKVTAFYNNRLLAIVLIQYENLLSGPASWVGYYLAPGQTVPDVVRIAVEQGWQHASKNVILIACLLGALAETQTWTADSKVGWCSQKFVGLTGGWKWKEVLRVAEGFLPIEVLIDDGERWFRWVMSVTTESWKFE